MRQPQGYHSITKLSVINDQWSSTASDQWSSISRVEHQELSYRLDFFGQVSVVICCRGYLQIFKYRFSISEINQTIQIFALNILSSSDPVAEIYFKGKYLHVAGPVYFESDCILAHFSSLCFSHSGRLARSAAFLIASGMNCSRRCLSTGFSRNSSGLK